MKTNRNFIWWLNCHRRAPQVRQQSVSRFRKIFQPTINWYFCWNWMIYVFHYFCSEKRYLEIWLESNSTYQSAQGYGSGWAWKHKLIEKTVKIINYCITANDAPIWLLISHLKREDNPLILDPLQLGTNSCWTGEPSMVPGSGRFSYFKPASSPRTPQGNMLPPDC